MIVARRLAASDLGRDLPGDPRRPILTILDFRKGAAPSECSRENAKGKPYPIAALMMAMLGIRGGGGGGGVVVICLE